MTDDGHSVSDTEASLKDLTNEREVLRRILKDDGKNAD